MIEIAVEKVNNYGVIPAKSHEFDGGYDLYSSEHKVIRCGDRKVVKTGISMAIPEGYVGLIWPRSGMAVKKGIDVLAGVIDSGYAGEIMVCLLNTNTNEISNSENDVKIKRGDRVAQIIIHKLPETKLVAGIVSEDTDRGSGGFGSTGI